MAEITLIAPPSPYLADDKASPPLGLLYVAAALYRAGIDVEVLDLASMPDWESRAAKVDSPVVGVNCVSPNYNFARRIGQLLPEKTFKIIGGPHPSALPEQTLEHSGFDLVVAGEAELLIEDIVRRALTGRIEDRLISCPPTPPQEVRPPARNLVDLRSYSPEMSADSSTTLISSRGCPFNCSFCYKMYDSRLVRFHPVDVVRAEIEELSAVYGFRNIVFTDDNFLTNRKHFEAIAGILKENGVRYRCMGRSDCLNDEVLSILTDTGCAEISFGVETGSQRLLNNMNKHNTVEQQKKAILAVKRAGLLAKAFFVVGFPGENEESIEETKRFFEETRPDKWLLSTFCPQPGSEAWRHPERFGITRLSEDYGQYWYVGAGGMGGDSFETDELTAERIHAMNRDLFNFFQSIAPTDRAQKHRH